MSKRTPIQTIQCAFASLLLGAGISVSAFADIAVVVHPSNPVATLSEDDVRRIFMGRMRLFPHGEVSVDAVDQEESLPLFTHFYAAITGLSPAKLKRQRASYLFSGKGRLPASLQNDAAVLDYVSRHPGGIGYVGGERVDERVKTVLVIRQ